MQVFSYDINHYLPNAHHPRRTMTSHVLLQDHEFVKEGGKREEIAFSITTHTHVFSFTFVG